MSLPSPSSILLLSSLYLYIYTHSVVERKYIPIFNRCLIVSSSFRFSFSPFSFLTCMAANLKSGGGIASLGKRLLNRTSTRTPSLFISTSSPTRFFLNFSLITVPFDVILLAATSISSLINLPWHDFLISLFRFNLY